jgi:hypothetical protein
LRDILGVPITALPTSGDFGRMSNQRRQVESRHRCDSGGLHWLADTAMSTFVC